MAVDRKPSNPTVTAICIHNITRFELSELANTPQISRISPKALGISAVGCADPVTTKYTNPSTIYTMPVTRVNLTITPLSELFIGRNAEMFSPFCN